MGWRGVVRSIEREARRHQRELERQQKEFSKMQAFEQAKYQSYPDILDIQTIL